MNTLPPGPRRFGDEEITKIIRRASELQRAEPAQSDPSGMSLAELEEIAAEAGIDVANIRRAVAELDATPSTSDFADAFLGAPTKVRYERSVPGELAADDFGRLVPMLQTLTGQGGQPNLVGRTLAWSWTQPNTNRQLEILVTSQDGETLVRLEERSGQLAGALHGGLGGGSVGIGLPIALAAGQAGGVLVGAATGLGVLGLTYFVARTIYRTLWRKREKDIGQVFGELVTYIERTTASAGTHVVGQSSPQALPAPDQPTGR